MTTPFPKLPTQLLSFMTLIMVACWSVTEVLAWVLASVIGHAYAVLAACQSLEIKRTSLDVTAIYNSINYPDEVAPLA